ncbi:MAG: M67 family metallopeptidase [Anaerolineales bacterium]
MSLIIPIHLLQQIHAHGERAYPEEGAGFLLGVDEGQQRRVLQVFATDNTREDAARRNRYLVTPEAYLQAEITADRLGLSLIGVFHSHPDHPNRPSEFDREWAQPFFSYLITSVQQGRAVESRSWRLVEDRSHFIEEAITLRKE